MTKKVFQFAMLLVATIFSVSAYSQATLKKIHQTDYSTFNIGNTALVLIDHQVGVIGSIGELANADEKEQVKMWVRVMARFAKDAGIPIVLTSSMETEQQGPMLPEFKDIMPKEYEARIQRTGIVNAWDDPRFVAAIKATGKKNIIMGGVSTDVCLVPAALSAQKAGYNVVALVDVAAANTKLGAQNSRDLMQQAGIQLLTVTPLITNLLGNYKNPAAGAFYKAVAAENVFGVLGKGNTR